VLRNAWMVLVVAVPGLLVCNLSCGPSCPDGWTPTESGECVSDDGDDDAGDDDGGDDDGADDDTSGTDEDGDGWTVEDGDCDDTDDTINPGETEVPCDGDDNDCNPKTEDDPADGDGDGITVCDGDCDDTTHLVSPDAPEVLGNATDDDCDSSTDEVQVLYLIKGSDAFDAEVMGTRLAAETGGDVEIKETVDIETTSEMDAVAADIAHYHVVLVEYRTDTGGSWGGDHTYLTTWGLPILALGTGGGALLDDLGANLNFGAPVTTATGQISVVVKTHAFFDGVSFTKDQATVTSSDEPVYGLPTTPGEPLAFHPDNAAVALITHDVALADAWLFGFDATGDAFTTDGITIIANILTDIAS